MLQLVCCICVVIPKPLGAWSIALATNLAASWCCCSCRAWRTACCSSLAACVGGLLVDGRRRWVGKGVVVGCQRMAVDCAVVGVDGRQFRMTVAPEMAFALIRSTPGVHARQENTKAGVSGVAAALR